MSIIFFLLLQSTIWYISAAQPPSESGDVGRSFAIIPIVVAGAFFFTGIVFVSFRRRLGACLFGIIVEREGGIIRRRREGLSQEEIEGFPTYFYEDVKMHREVDSELECAICLNQFQDHQALRLMPECSHIFHPQCIDPWLHTQATCPVCRKVLEPSSNTLSTSTRPLLRTLANALEDINHDVIIREPSPPVKSPVHNSSNLGGPSEPESSTIVQIDEPKVVPSLVNRPDRFTLKLPEEARCRLESTLWRFAKGSSGRKQYRSKTPESGRIELNQLRCEPNRFDISSLRGNWKSFVSQPASPFSDSGVCNGDTLVHN